MEDMRNDIIEYLRKEVLARCEKPENKFGVGCYYHIEAVVRNAELLSERTGADKEIVVIAAWLHDIASVTDYSLYEMHHIHGADIAYDILNTFHYDSDKIKLVQECIRNHRGSVQINKKTIEELCVADADAISHFDNIPSLLFLAYSTKKMGYNEGIEFVKGKLDRSFAKISHDSQEYYIDKYNQIMEILK